MRVVVCCWGLLYFSVRERCGVRAGCFGRVVVERYFLTYFVALQGSSLRYYLAEAIAHANFEVSMCDSDLIPSRSQVLVVLAETA